MPAQTTNLFLLEDLEDVDRTKELAQSDLDALHAIADWIKTFVVKPHKDLGRAGTVQPADGDDVAYNVIVVVFGHLPADRAKGVFDDVLQHLAVPSYAEDGILFGPYYDEEWLSLWAHRYGESGTRALAEELRRLPWRVPATRG